MMSAFPQPRRRRRIWLFALVPALVVGLVVIAVAVFVPARTVPGSAVAAPNLTTTTTTLPFTPPPDDEEEVVVKSKDGKSEITVPGSWSALPKNLGYEGFQIAQGHIFDEQYVAVMSHVKSDFLDFPAFVGIVRETVGTELKNLRMTGEKRIKIGGLPAVQFRYTGSYLGIKSVFWDTAVRGDKAYYQVIGWTLPSREATAGPAIIDVIASFRETVTD